jgi:CRP-like cAMP-binding protein
VYTELLNHIKTYVQLQPQHEEVICSHMQPKTFKKKEFLLEPGKICQGNYFVVKGCIRLYFINKKLNEQIVNFGLENWWIADQDSLMNQKPSACYIQTVEPSEVLLLTEKERNALIDDVPVMETYFRIMLQKAYVAAQRRIGFIFNMTDEERYLHFNKVNPGFMQRVPQYMLASYLGFTPQFLSRLRAKKN